MQHTRTTAGFTLIEMIVSLALFSVVVTISVGALLVLIASNRQLQDEQAVLTNLSFALDSMTREIRTGSAFVCGSESGVTGIFRDSYNLDGVSTSSTRDCFEGRENDDVHGITIVEGGDSITEAGSRILYFYNEDTSALYRKVGSSDAEQITSDSVAIVDADFFVTGSEPLGLNDTDVRQPAVTIYIAAQVAGQTNSKTYPIQTTIVQRGLDL